MVDRCWPDPFSAKVVKEAYGSKLCSYTISLEAWRRGLTVTILDSEFNRYKIESNSRSIIFNRSKCSLTTNYAISSIKNKQTARELMLEGGVKTPLGKAFIASQGVIPLLEYADEIGYPVVIKPLDGTLGRGVFTNIKNRESLADSYIYLTDRLGVEKIIVEKYVVGDDYRVFVIGDQAVGAVKRVPANVVGDGVHTIDELISIKNDDRKKNPFLSKGLIKKDREVLYKIKDAGYRLNSILKDNELLYLRGKANASAGGDVIDATDVLPSIVKESAIKAVASIPGLEYCGVDVLYDTLTGSHAVIEMNSRAQIGVNMYPSEGQGRNIPKAIIDHYYPDAPLKHEQTDPRLIFDISMALDPIKNGITRSITLAPIRKRSKKGIIRKCYIFRGSNLTSLGKNKIIQLARTLKVDGYIKKEENEKIILVVSGSKSQVNDFLEKVCDIMGSKVSKSNNWVGVITQGFKSLG